MKPVGEIVTTQHWAYQKIENDVDFAGILVAVSKDANKENLAEEFKDMRFPIQNDRCLLVDKTLIEENPDRQFGWTWINQKTGEMGLNRFESHRTEPEHEIRVIGNQILEEVTKMKSLSKEEQAFKYSMYTEPRTVAGNLRDEMVSVRRGEFENLPDKIFLIKVNNYFEQNATMSGEKVLKDLAASYLKQMEESLDVYQDDAHPNGLKHAEFMDDLRDDMKDMMANIAIKETKVEDAETIYAMYSDGIRDITEDGYTHALSVTISDSKIYPDSRLIYSVGDVPDGFTKNHPNMEGMKADLVMVDNSKGKFKNMTCRMMIDLMQEDVGWPVNEKLVSHDDDFTAGVNSISMNGSSMDVSMT